MVLWYIINLLTLRIQQDCFHAVLIFIFLGHCQTWHRVRVKHSPPHNGMLRAQLVERPTEMPRHSTDAGLGPCRGEGLFTLGQLSVQTL